MIAVIGAANIDLHTQFEKDILLRNSNPAITRTSVGGVSRNVADNLSRLGEEIMFFTGIGDDLFGREIMHSCRELGIDASHAYLSKEFSTGTYIDILDANSDMYVAAADTRIIESIPLSYFDEISEYLKSAAAVVVDPNLSAEQLVRIYEVSGGNRIFIDPTSRARAKKMKNIFNIFHFIKPNNYELEELADMPIETEEDVAKGVDFLLGKGVDSVAVSLGEKGCYYADQAGTSLFRPQPYICEMKNATGGGDAFLSGYVKSFCDAMPLEYRLDYALACGTLTVMSADSINENISDEYVKAFIDENMKEVK
ncbi:MAG: carbohydrate kinase family protein [Clostridiales bacterium]|nr:carbohydrate kinase family protein [Candidatus Crickella caballi]